MHKNTDKKVTEKYPKKKGATKKSIWLAIGAAALILIVAALLYFLVFRKERGFDYEAYGQALTEIENKADKDQVIILIDGSVEIPKSEYYKLKLLAEYSEIEMDDDVIYESLIQAEIGYLEAVEAGVYVSYEKSLDIQHTQYRQCQYFVENKEEGYYEQAKEFLSQMELTAKGMGLTMEEYMEYLAREYMKSDAVAELEMRWQSQYYTDGFETVTEQYSTVDEYIDYMYEQARQQHTVERIA